MRRPLTLAADSPYSDHVCRPLLATSPRLRGEVGPRLGEDRVRGHFLRADCLQWSPKLLQCSASRRCSRSAESCNLDRKAIHHGRNRAGLQRAARHQFRRPAVALGEQSPQYKDRSAPAEGISFRSNRASEAYSTSAVRQWSNYGEGAALHLSSPIQRPAWLSPLTRNGHLSVPIPTSPRKRGEVRKDADRGSSK